MNLSSSPAHLVRISFVLAALVLLPTTARAAQEGVQPFPPDEKPYGLSLGEWAAAWNQWAQSIPMSADPGIDGTGVYAGIGQHLPVWFLPVGPGGRSTRTIIVPAGAALLIPGPFEGLFEFPGNRTEDELRAELRTNASNLAQLKWAMTVDGAPIPDLQRYRVQTPLFSIVFPPGNFANLPVAAGKDQRLVGVTDGYFVLLQPPPVGKHSISVTFTAPDTGKPVGLGTFTVIIQSPNEPIP